MPAQENILWLACFRPRSASSKRQFWLRSSRREPRIVQSPILPSGYAFPGVAHHVPSRRAEVQFFSSGTVKHCLHPRWFQHATSCEINELPVSLLGSKDAHLTCVSRLAREFGRSGFAAAVARGLMIILGKSEAEALEQFLSGERLWSWPNGRIQLGQTFPDIAIINRLVAEGLLDQDYEPTEAGRSALQSWLAATLPSSAVPASSQGRPQSITGD